MLAACHIMLAAQCHQTIGIRHYCRKETCALYMTQETCALYMTQETCALYMTQETCALYMTQETRSQVKVRQSVLTHFILLPKVGKFRGLVDFSLLPFSSAYVLDGSKQKKILIFLSLSSQKKHSFTTLSGFYETF